MASRIKIILIILIGIIGLASLVHADEFDEVIIRNGLTDGNLIKSDSNHKLIDAGVTANTPTPQPTPTLVPTATPQPTATPGAAGATPTPLTFGTNGDIATFAATELGSYAGAACPTPGMVISITGAGGLACATPVPVATATPQPTPTLVPTATPQPTPVGINDLVEYGMTSGAGAMPDSSTLVFPIQQIGASVVETTAGNVSLRFARQGVVSFLRCGLGGTGFTGGENIVWTVQENGVDSAMTCTAAVGNNPCEDSTHTFTLEKGNTINIKGVSSALTNNDRVTCAVEINFN